MQGLLAGLLVLSVTYFGGKGLLQRFFFRTGYVYAEETERAEELQEYVTQNKLSASDYKMLKYLSAVPSYIYTSAVPSLNEILWYILHVRFGISLLPYIILPL